MILLIDNYDSFTYNLYQAFAKFDTVRVVRNDEITVDELAQLKPDKVILSPGPGKPSQAGICFDVVNYCAKQHIPLLGVCLGHQAIVEVFGGKVEVAKVPVHGKETSVFHHRQGIYSDLPLPFKAGRYHSLYAPTDSIPDCIIVESENAEGMVMGVRHEALPIYGVQFHPESILTPSGGKLIENFVKLP
jgi:anthranilate synthase/aminodeoxychorismate synthase-like glutamine amidotransferase